MLARFAATLGFVATLGGAPAALTADAPGPRFNREIRPILSDKCFFCHGPDKAKRKSGLRLDDREAAIEAGALVPGKPDDSELWKRVAASDADDIMPPTDSHKSLKREEVELLRRWIEAGAPYEPHWAYVPIERPPAPGGARGAAAIDAFVGQRLAAEGLAPSAAADRRTLLRRLSLDLTGLPPTPTELAAFERDHRPDAYARQVDRLLASPHYGERMAVPWLDVVRYADTVGYHGDQNQHVFPYRDYVIASFNANKPFDRFTLEQVAGDLLPKPSREALVATGFLRLNMVTREGGAQPAEYLAKYMADRVRAIGTAWLGSTLGCAQCHDHKYDPIEIRDFYAMGAFFADIREWGVYMDYSYTPNPDLKGFSNDHPFPPEMSVPSPFLRARASELLAQKRAILAALTRESLAAAPDAFRSWQAEIDAFATRHPDGWRFVAPTVAERAGAKAEVQPDGVVVWRERGERRLELILPASGTVAAVRLDLVPAEATGARHAAPGKKSVRLELALRLRRQGETQPLDLLDAQASVQAPTWRNGHRQRNLLRGWHTPAGYVRDRVSSVWELAQPLALQPGDELVVEVKSDSVAAMAFAVSPLAGYAGLQVPSHWGKKALDVATPPHALARFLRGSPGRGARAEAWALSWAGANPAHRSKLRALHQAWQSIADGQAETLIVVSQAPRITRVLPRGNWQDETGEVVQPAVPHFLPQLPATKGPRATRLDLARWLVSRENPLTARAFMNRLWKQFFGTGLSLVLDDLGGQGEPPTHPELLDWLAAEFMSSGWNVKHMVRLLVLSDTYQQDSTARRELLARDPQNRLLARQSQRRLDAEFVRDNALFVAGLLNRSLGGPSAMPPQPDGYYENLEFPTRVYVVDEAPLSHRRGVYTHWQRTFLHPMLANFDAPSREECVADRPYSNTPQQALTLLNDPSFVEAASAFAARILNLGGDDARKIDQAFEMATGRRPNADENRVLQDLLAAQAIHFAAHPAEAARLADSMGEVGAGLARDRAAAWVAVARVMLNLYETITRI